MKKLKMPLLAMALIMGAGLAFATQVSSGDSAPDCEATTQCEFNPAAVCCIDNSDPQNPVEIKGDKLP